MNKLLAAAAMVTCAVGGFAVGAQGGHTRCNEVTQPVHALQRSFGQPADDGPVWICR